MNQNRLVHEIMKARFNDLLDCYYRNFHKAWIRPTCRLIRLLMESDSAGLGRTLGVNHKAVSYVNEYGY